MIRWIAWDLWKSKYVKGFKAEDGLGCVTAVTHSPARVCPGEDLKLSEIMLFC